LGKFIAYAWCSADNGSSKEINDQRN